MPEDQSSDSSFTARDWTAPWLVALMILAVALVAGTTAGVLAGRSKPQDSSLFESSPFDDDHTKCLSDIPEVCDAVRFVETTRKRPFKTFPKIEFLDDDEFLDRVSELWDVPVDAQEIIDAEAFRVLGLIDASTDVSEVLGALDAAGLLGLYSIDDNQLWVRGSDLGLLELSVLVHELTHAFDDQWFDLDADIFHGDSFDNYNAIAATIEGDAMRVEELWRSTLDPKDRRKVVEEEYSSLTDEEQAQLRAFPPALLEIAGWPYTEGLDFMEYVSEVGGEDAVDELFANPPESTEQVLHPEALNPRDPAVRVKAPRPQAEIVGAGVLGELVLALLFDPIAAEGWGGDSFVLYKRNSQVCVMAKIVADTGQDQRELLSSALTWSAGSNENSFRRASSNDDGVNLESCLEVGL